jgi:hypothetical protein
MIVSNIPTTEKLATRADVLAHIKSLTDTVLLSFSRGKDSLASWIVLRDYGFKVIPFHMLLIPGLRFVEESLLYFEDKFETHIHRVMHPNFWHWLKTCGYQTPERIRIIEAMDLPRTNYMQINRKLADEHGMRIPWCAHGVRAGDSMMRRIGLARHGPISRGQCTFTPVFDMTNDEVYRCIADAGLKLPIDYSWFGRSFDGVDERFLTPIKVMRPDDYATIKDWFPLVDLCYARQEVTRHASIA